MTHLDKSPVRAAVSETLREKPIIAVVRSTERSVAEAHADAFLDSSLGLIEITFTVPEATSLLRELLERRGPSRPPFLGMGTVTTAARARSAVAAGAEFLVSPNVSAGVADVARDAGLFLVMGALTPTEIVEAHELGADLVKVFPLPPLGPDYLRIVRGPLGDIEMLASGGYGVEEIAAYREAGARAFGIGAPLLAETAESTRARIDRAMAAARGEAHPAAASRT